MKLFVGSAGSYISYDRDGKIDPVATNSTALGKLTQSLRAIGYDVHPWWEAPTLPPGGELIDSLINLAKSCDGGVFVFGKDHKMQRSGTQRQKKWIPNINVVLESGMFFSALGKDRTFIIKVGKYTDINFPSDIQGKLLPDLSDAGLILAIDEFFKKSRPEERYEKFTFFHHKDAIESVIEKKYREWSTKALYIGTESARRWKAIETDAQYLQNTRVVPIFMKDIHTDAAIKIDFRALNNIISFGPGCGVFDNAVVSEIYSVNNRISYIPVDINPILAFEASNYIQKKNPDITVPFSIIDDFEDNYKYVGDILKRKLSCHSQVNMFIMLGGTFSNLEGVETVIVNKLSTWMSSTDYLVIDALIKKDGYTFSTDSNLEVEHLPVAYQHFMRNGGIRKFFSSAHQARNATFLRGIGKALSNHVRGIDVLEDRKIQYSELPSTSVVTYNLHNVNLPDVIPELVIAKRYKFEELLAFLSRRFTVMHAMNGLESEGGVKSRGVFLLKKLH